MRRHFCYHKATITEWFVLILSTIDLAHLRLLATFAIVVECGSFAAAARRLRSSRSRISEQVAQLESSLGIRLLQRSTRKLNVTQEGQEIYQQASRLPGILEAVEAIASPTIPSGRVSITMNHDIAHKYLLPVLGTFQQEYPQIRLDLVLDDARLDLIAEQIDLAIRIGIPRDESLIARVLHEERFALFASPDFLARHQINDRPAEIEQLPWVIMSQTETQHLLRHDNPVEIHPEKPYRCNSPLMVQQMVIQGLGVGALLPTTVRQEVKSGRLIRILPSISSEAMVFSLVYPSRRQVPLRTRAVIDFLLAARIFA